VEGVEGVDFDAVSSVSCAAAEEGFRFATVRRTVAGLGTCVSQKFD
jgi:hypothetical protein